MPPPTIPGLAPVVLEAREKLAAGRERLKKQHESGSPGIQVCAALTELLDSVLLDLYHAAVTEVGENLAEFESRAALVPNGGFGRRDVAPFSDVDLMLLHLPGAEAKILPVIRRFTQHVVDVGLQLGFCARTIADCCAMSLKDATIFTSLAESRFLAGNQSLFDKFQIQFSRHAKRHSRNLLAALEEARREERRQFGETNHLLEPNIKRSRGGLRDIQLIRWVGFVRCGEVDPDELVRADVLSKEDYNRLLEAREFLLRLRNELHFHANRAADVLDKGEQLRLATLLGYQGSEAVLPVEKFMQDFFHHTSEVRYIASNFLADAKPSARAAIFLEPFVSHRADRDFWVGPLHIRASRNGLQKLCEDPAEVLRLMELASLYDKRIDHRTWSAIRDSMMTHPPVEMTHTTAQRFLALLSQSSRLGEQLRRLHELRVLEKIVPAVSHARCLLQFNEYHRYTVDEHSIRTIENCTSFRDRTDKLGEVYREIKRKDLLHLALLLHDLGKGFVEDHSEVGRRIAADTAKLLGLPERDSETLQFLVHKHLVMSHLAQFRDLNDSAVVVQFAVEVGSPDILKMLYVLTCADMAGVGPGVLTDWKLRLLTELYTRTMRHIAGDAQDTGDDQLLSYLRKQVRDRVKAATADEKDWWDKHIAALPPSYLVNCSAERISQELERLRQVPTDDAVAWGNYLPEQKAIEFTVGTYEQITPGIFFKLTGALSAKGLQILSAEINTLADGMVLDRFYVHDADYNQSPPAERLEEVSRALVAALKDKLNKPPAFRRLWNAQQKAANAKLSKMPTQVRVDSNTSERYTIVDVFTLDRMGLLYTISRTLFELGLSVGIAKIGTHLDQVVDVFYVTDEAGSKVQDELKLDEIRHRLLSAIEELAGNS